MIVVDGLTKSFGSVRAVDGLSFQVHPGRVTGFLGPNGAGKTTTIRVALGLAAATAGLVTIHGRAYGAITRPLNTVGAHLDPDAVHRGRSARAHLDALARSNGLPRARVDAVLAQVGMCEAAPRRVAGFSLGMRQRLGIASALLGDPAVLVFDEPSNGLDPEGIVWIRRLMKSLAHEGRTVLVSGHHLAEMADTADHLVVIGRGRLLADGSVADFIAEHASPTVHVVSPASVRLAELVERRGGRIIRRDDNTVSVAGLEARQVGELAAEHRIALWDLSTHRPSLEEAFMRLTAQATEFTTCPLSRPGPGEHP